MMKVVFFRIFARRQSGRRIDINVGFELAIGHDYSLTNELGRVFFNGKERPLSETDHWQYYLLLVEVIKNKSVNYATNRLSLLLLRSIRQIKTSVPPCKVPFLSPFPPFTLLSRWTTYYKQTIKGEILIKWGTFPGDLRESYRFWRMIKYTSTTGCSFPSLESQRKWAKVSRGK